MTLNNSWQDKANDIHNNKYDYSKVDYKTLRKKVIIICPEHGEFKQSLGSHIHSKAGCPKCGNVNTKIKKFADKETILNKLNNMYDYTFPDFEYTGQKSKIDFICKVHGKQNKLLNNLLQGHGCVKCSREKSSKLRTISTEKIIERCNIKHHNKYKYPDDTYTLQYQGNIICPIHGEFRQNMDDHARGHGCSSCSESKGEKQIRIYLEEAGIDYNSEYKFKDSIINKKRFDFYLPNYNTCIEYDGIQHFKSVKHFGGSESLKYTQQNDELKNKYCNDNNIKLIRISYKQINNIKEILDEQL